MEDSRRLLLEIANCPVVRDILSRSVSTHCCQTIVNSQQGDSFHLPEPWVGQIDRVPILFISSNPSIDREESFPDTNTKNWPSERIIDFFENRFTSSAGWVKNLRVLRRDGSYSKDWVRFWAATRARAAQLLQKSSEAVVPGVDFALMEVVHCKSKKEHGVSEALDFCTDRYLGRVMQVARAARVIVVYGGSARKAVCRWPALRGLQVGPRRVFGPSLIFGVARMLAFLPAPASWGGKKSFAAEELTVLRKYLQAEADT